MCRDGGDRAARRRFTRLTAQGRREYRRFYWPAMNPFFFGSSRKQLFGVHHPPKAATTRSAGILLCYPFGDEYMRTHKASRQLAMMLAKAGYHLLRFDYFGTGDSAGAGEDATIAQWLEDVATAADELKEASGVTRISLVGLRLGATLAAQAVTSRTDVDDLVLWDPIVAGNGYVEELMAAPFSSPGPGGTRNRQATLGAAGFPVTPALRNGFDELDLARMPLESPRRIALVTSHERNDYTRLKEQLQAKRPGTFFHQLVPSPAPWIEVEKSNGAMVLPHQMIQTIVGHLTGNEPT
jgi:pimeloyl-ACP methyl ester carboxylesterase